MNRTARVRALLGRLVRPDLVQDAHIYGGLLIASAGGWQLSPGVTLIALGAVLVALGILAGRGRPSSENNP